MFRILIAALIALAPTLAWASCTTHSYTYNGRFVTCTTCCYYGHCTTNCY